MKQRHYKLTSHITTAVALLSLLGIILTIVLGKRNGGKNNSSGGGGPLRGDGSGSSPNGGGGTPADPGRYYPPGPYVSVDQATEMVTLRHPEVPELIPTQTDCPWDDDTNLVSWHEASTWTGGSVPSQDLADVTLPAGKRVVIRQSIPVRLGIVTIPPNSELLIQPTTDGSEIAVQAHGFDVRGKLVVGSATCPIRTPVTITLTGARPADVETHNAQTPTYKGIHVVQGGELQVHGQRYFHTWTRLARTVDPNDASADARDASTLMLQDPVNWEPGQEVVIVTSALKDSRDSHQNEVRVIQEIHPNPPAGVGSVVYLTTPLEYRHVGNQHYQVEVALLTRKIKIQGHADDSEPTNPDPLDCISPNALYNSAELGIQCPNTETTGFGGHIMVQGLAQVEGVELYRMGQTNVLARYPMHFHLIGECPTCYLKHSSIHRSYYRCATIHGTHAALVTENVCFDIIGTFLLDDVFTVLSRSLPLPFWKGSVAFFLSFHHRLAIAGSHDLIAKTTTYTGYAYYFEDGVETRNTLSYNLAAHIHWLGPEPGRGVGQSSELYVQSKTLAFPGDVTASGFYISVRHVSACVCLVNSPARA